MTITNHAARDRIADRLRVSLRIAVDQAIEQLREDLDVGIFPTTEERHRIALELKAADQIISNLATLPDDGRLLEDRPDTGDVVDLTTDLRRLNHGDVLAVRALGSERWTIRSYDHRQPSTLHATLGQITPDEPVLAVWLSSRAES